MQKHVQSPTKMPRAIIAPIGPLSFGSRFFLAEAPTLPLPHLLPLDHPTSLPHEPLDTTYRIL